MNKQNSRFLAQTLPISKSYDNNVTFEVIDNFFGATDEFYPLLTVPKKLPHLKFP